MVGQSEARSSRRERYNEQVLKAQQMTQQQPEPEQNKGASKGQKQTQTSLRAEQQLAQAPGATVKPLRRLTGKATEHEVFKQAGASIRTFSATTQQRLLD